jgi:uncharacterized protein
MPNYDKLPLFPLHAVLFPQMSLPLHIFEERYRLMIGRCVERGEPFGVVLLQHGTEVETGSSDRRLHPVGTTARIEKAEHLSDGRYFIGVRGETRFRILEEFDDELYLTARVRLMSERGGDALTVQPVFDAASELFREYVGRLLSGSKLRLSTLQLPQDPALLSYAIGASLQVTLCERQKLLEAASIGSRLQREVEIMRSERLEYGEPAQMDAESEFEGDAGEPGQTDRRTISRVDPSYSQCFYSRN